MRTLYARARAVHAGTSRHASLSLGAMLKRVARVALAAEGALIVGEQMPALVASPPPSARRD